MIRSAVSGCAIALATILLQASAGAQRWAAPNCAEPVTQAEINMCARARWLKRLKRQSVNSTDAPPFYLPLVRGLFCLGS